MPDLMRAFTPAHELAALIRAKEVSPVEIMDLFLRRIAALNPKLAAFLTVVEPEARAAAAAAEKRVARGGDDLPPLLGVPVGVKDLELTKGIRTTMGSLIYKNYIPDENAITVERLRKAGAIVVGKTNTPEFGLLGQTMNSLGEDGRNPWDLERTCGGSSGGSAAAVAAGMVPVATGTDSAGSINNPANLCGVVGVKPTLGRVPNWPISGPLLFSHNGPITRTVADAALMLEVMAGHDQRDPMALREAAPPYFSRLAEADLEDLSDLRVAWSPDLGFAQVDGEVAAITARAAAAFEAFRCPVEHVDMQLGNPFGFFDPLDMGDRFCKHGHLLEKHRAELYPSSIEEYEKGSKVTLKEYVRAMDEMWAFRSRMAEFFEKFDLLITPANPVTAYPVRNPPKEIGGQPAKPHWSTFAIFRVPWNITGSPAMTIPSGWSSQGLPVGILIIGRLGREDVMLRAAAAFERAHPWADRIPAVAMI